MNEPASLIFARYAGKKDWRITMECTDMHYKEVYFDKYCKTCKYSDVDDVKDPCNEC